MAHNEKLTKRVREALEHLDNVEEKKMFRGITFMVDGKMCISTGDVRLMCRIDPAIHMRIQSAVAAIFHVPHLRRVLQRDRQTHTTATSVCRQWNLQVQTQRRRVNCQNAALVLIDRVLRVLDVLRPSDIGCT